MAAILFPVFGRVREKARQTACMSNQRQMVAAAMLYAQDHEDELPGFADVWTALNLDAALLKCPSKPTLTNGYAYNAMISGRMLGNLRSANASDVMCTVDGQHTGLLVNTALWLGDVHTDRHNSFIASFVDGHAEHIKGDTASVTAWNDRAGALKLPTLFAPLGGGAVVGATVAQMIMFATEDGANTWTVTPAAGWDGTPVTGLRGSPSHFAPLAFPSGGPYTITAGSSTWTVDFSGTPPPPPPPDPVSTQVYGAFTESVALTNFAAQGGFDGTRRKGEGPTKVATWTCGGLTVGTTYHVALTWDITGLTGGYGAVPYTVTHGGGTASGTLDQTKVPRADFLRKDSADKLFTFQMLGDFVPDASGAIVVSMHGNTSTQYCNADAVIITTAAKNVVVDDLLGSGYSENLVSSTSTGAFYGGAFHYSDAATWAPTWTFTGLQPGASYYAATTWTTNVNRAMAVTYTCAGTGSVTGPTINQRISPLGFTAGGVLFQYVTTAPVIAPTGGTITVTAARTTGRLCADAMMLTTTAP